MKANETTWDPKDIASHKPLPNRTSTRLLTLEPGSSTDIISASFAVVDLAQAYNDYEAISYTWGPPQAEYAIMVDGHPVQIRTNLHQALLRLRHPTEPRILWCDYLCITQTDLAEKAQQVQMIGRIFGSATKVRVWLGEHANYSEELFREWTPKPTKSKGILEDWKRRLKSGKDEEQIRGALRRAQIWVTLFQRPYWRRTWIVQELRLARAVTIRIGPDESSWEKLISARFTEIGMHGRFDHIAMRSYYDESDLEDPQFLLGASLSWISRFVPVPLNLKGKKAPGHVIMDDWERGPRDIFDVVGRFRNTFCHDKLDKVFAIHTLERRRDGEKPLPVRYDMSQDLLLMLYAERYVYNTAAAKSRGGFLARVLDQQTLPDTSGVIDSLGMVREACELAAKEARGRAMAAENEAHAIRWRRVAKGLVKAFEAAAKEREFDKLLFEGKATVTHQPPSVDEQMFWLGKQRHYQQ